MMKRLFCIYDEKAAYYSPPFVAGFPAEAMRIFADAVNDHESRLSLHPADYTLYEMAEWDEHSGVIEPHASYIWLAKGDQLVVQHMLEENARDGYHTRESASIGDGNPVRNGSSGADSEVEPQ